MVPQVGGCGSYYSGVSGAGGGHASMVPQVGGCGSSIKLVSEESLDCFNGAAGWGLRESDPFSAVTKLV